VYKDQKKKPHIIVKSINSLFYSESKINITKLLFRKYNNNNNTIQDADYDLKVKSDKICCNIELSPNQS
jgi:hypothetical protein